MSKPQDILFADTSRLVPFLKRLNAYAWRYPQWMWPFILCIILVGISDALWPLIWKEYLDGSVFPNAGIAVGSDIYDFPWQKIALFPALFLLNGILQVVAIYFFIIYTGKVKEKVLYDLRQEMFTRIQYLSYSYYDKVQNGWLLARVNSDSERLSDLISWGFLDLIWGVIMLFFSILFLFIYDWRLGMILLLSMPFVVLVSYLINRYILAYSRQARRLNSEMTATFTENINGVLVNKSLAREEAVTEKFKEQGERFLYYSSKTSIYSGLFVPAVIFIGTVTAAIMLQLGGYWASLPTGGISVGTLAAAMLYATRVFLPVMDIARFYGAAHNSLSAGERVFQLLDEEIIVKDRDDTLSDHSLYGDIAFKDVSFSYERDQKILEHFNLYIPRGQRLALVGPSGQGKSTIISLLCRFYDPIYGEVIINGKEYREIKQINLRKNTGVVLQKPHLFEGTLLENLRFAKADTSYEEAKSLLDMIGAEKLSQQLLENVGEGGDNLSLGEKQIISIARVILLNPAIFIFDEATSSIDPLSEVIIQKGLDMIMDKRTSIIVAHRLSTIIHCDRILYIEKGKIIEDGSHSDLMKKRGAYFQLYIRQLSELQMSNG